MDTRLKENLKIDQIRLIKVMYDASVTLSTNEFKNYLIEENELFYNDVTVQFDISDKERRILENVYEVESILIREKLYLQEIRKKFLKYLRVTGYDYNNLKELSTYDIRNSI